MKVLWVSIVKFPELSHILGEQEYKYASWMSAAAEKLITSSQVSQLSIICENKETKTFQKIKGKKITYYLVPAKDYKNNKKVVQAIRNIHKELSPDITHIHGCEYPLAYSASIALNMENTLVSIQGLPSICYRYFFAGMSYKDIFKNITLKDILLGSFLLFQAKDMYKRGRYETEILKRVYHIIGRTHWDHAHIRALNSTAKYYIGEETLRGSFYHEIWSLSKCVKGRIFISNSFMPLKGAHIVIKALPFVHKVYPQAHLHIVGKDVLNPRSIKDKLRMTGYNLYLARLIRKLKLEKHVTFLGFLNEDEMRKEFLNANVYVLPSSIENSPNSLCEAQILGVPIMASYVGGVPNFIEEGKTGYLYRFEEYEMLASTLIEILGREDFSELSYNERSIALKRHDAQNNVDALLRIYDEILGR